MTEQHPSLHPVHEHDLRDAALIAVLEAAALAARERYEAMHEDEEDRDGWRSRVLRD